MQLGRYSMGIGDRFGLQGEAQLKALIQGREAGVSVVPVWNKSHREHQIVGSEPPAVRREAEAAVRALGWDGDYHVDADHVTLETVEPFVDCSDFFTLDVADWIGKPAGAEALDAFRRRHGDLLGEVAIPGFDRPLALTSEAFDRAAGKYLRAVREAGRLYRHIEEARGGKPFVAEVSMDETDEPQGPAEILLILAAVADEGLPAATLAPKFSGRFNKGVDYVGDVPRFALEFERDLLVLAFAVQAFGLPRGLKLSVHSGSDKFSLYPAIRETLARHGAGVHLKTAGTTWLEELIGLAEAGGDGLSLVGEIYARALERFDELCAPYAAVIDIDRRRLPDPDTVRGWRGEAFAAALRHDPTEPRYDANLRQLLHVAYKVAAELGERYAQAVREARTVVGGHVTANLFERHLKPLFIG